MLVLHEGIKDQPKCRVELHIHLDGAVRLETAWDLLRRKKLPLPGDGSLAALQSALTIAEPSTLVHFLRGFQLLSPALEGDLEAITRVSREFVEDRSRDHVAYCEARLSPHLLMTGGGRFWEDIGCSGSYVAGKGAVEGEDVPSEGGKVTVESIVEAVLCGLTDGEQRCPGTTVRLILCCVRGKPEWSWEVLRLCEQYKDRGVLGIDIVGSHCDDLTRADYSEGADVFRAAAAAGIRRTVHAGEDEPAASVLAAVETLQAERVGHGYRVVEDDVAYARCRAAGVHFEVCPHSSYLTGSVGGMATASTRHPVCRFVEDGVSFSINTDDPSLTATDLTKEYALLRSWGFTEAHFAKANFAAAAHSFLPPAEKQALLQQLREAYGVLEAAPPSSISDKPERTSPPKPNVTFNTWENRT